MGAGGGWSLEELAIKRGHDEDVWHWIGLVITNKRLTSNWKR